MGMGFIDIILSWMLSEGVRVSAGIWDGKSWTSNRAGTILGGEVHYIDRWLGRVSGRQGFAMSTISCHFHGLSFVSA